MMILLGVLRSLFLIAAIMGALGFINDVLPSRYRLSPIHGVFFAFGITGFIVAMGWLMP